MDIRLETVSPATAENWLNTSNTHNRKMREGVAEKYADDMKHGRWTQCPEPISFYADGSLADGQHRLWGIVDSGVPIEFPIARGLPREAGLNINTGLGRTLVDNASISGKDNGLSNELISLSRAIAQGNRGSSGTPLSNSVKLEMVAEHREAANWTISNGPKGRGLRNSLVLAAVARAWYHEDDVDRLKRFCDVFSSGYADGDTESAAIALRNYFLQKEGLTDSARWIDTFLKAQNAIAYFMKGRKLTVIKGVTEEAYPLKKKRKVASKATVH